MARTNFLVATVFFSILLFASPTLSQITSDGTPVPVNDTWQLTFVKLAGTQDTNMPDPSLLYDSDAETYEVTSAGHDIWDSQDGCAFTYMEISGDFSVRVRVDTDFAGGSNTWAKSCVMVRDSVTPESKYVIYGGCRSSTDGGDAFMQWRDTDNTGAAWTDDDTAIGTLGYPRYFRLDRVGDDFIGYYSTDGVNWTQGANPASHTTVMTDPVYAGFALTSHEETVETTVTFSHFSIPGHEPETTAKPMVLPGNWVYGDEQVTLDGSNSIKTTGYQWSQVGPIGGEPTITITNPTNVTATFTPPGREIGYTLTLNLTVTGETGTDSKDFPVYVRAINVPRVAPSNLRILPMDFGASGLGFRLTWDPVFDATKYMLAMNLGGQYFWMYSTTETRYDFMGMFDGQEQIVTVRGENKFSNPNPLIGDHGEKSEDVKYIAMPNVAKATGATPPSGYVNAVPGQPASLTGLNDGATGDNNHSNNGVYKAQDFWGYLWGQPLFFDNLVYFTGQFAADGGWFTSLKVQVTQDGTTWTDVHGPSVVPRYDFTDSRADRTNFTRYDIQIPPTRGTGIRIFGTPGGMNAYTSIAELQVFGNQLRPSDFISAYGVDADVPEGTVGSLDGMASFSLAGDIVSYAWTGPVPITDADKAMASFSADYVGADTELVFSLTVQDSIGQTATDDDVRITVKNVVTTANAGPDQQVLENTEATLDASASLTTTGNLTYLWTQTKGTLVGVTGSTTKTVTFTAPILWDYSEELAFKLDVNDGAGGTGTDEVVILVRNSLSWPAYPLTQAPNTYYFQDMLHLGQYHTDRLTNPHNWGTITSGFDPLAPFGGAPYINPYPGLAYDFSGTNVTVTRNPMVWTPDHAANGMFLYGGGDPPSELQSYYHIYILCPDDRDVRWHRRHDDEIRGWNNGVLIFTDNSWDNDAERTQDGFAAQGTGLSKGLNSLTFMFEEGGGGNWIAVGVTDLNDQPFDDLYYSFGPSFLLADAYASRDLPISYEPGGTTDVSLSLRVNPDNAPGSVNIMENVPAGIPDANVTAPDAIVSGGKIIWTLSGGQVKTGTLSYSMVIPAEMSQALNFTGTLSFGTTTSDIYGDDLVYAVPLAPASLEAEMLVAAHLSWSAPPQAGIRGYVVYRSDDGGAYQQIATVSGTSYVDMSAVPGVNYSYQVSAVNVPGFEGPPSLPTPQATVVSMVLVEAEDFNYGGGLYPGPGPTDVPAVEAPSAGDYDLAYDYYFQSTTYPAPNGYRPKDDVDCRESTPGQWIIGYTSVGDWWRYTVNVPTAGWVKVVLKLASPGGGSLTVFWDEQPVGNVSFVTGSWGTYIWFPVEDSFQSTAGVHTLRVEKTAAEMDFDTIAFGWGWTPPARKVIWEDPFEDYAITQEVIDNGGWEIINGSTDPDTGDPAPTADGAWKLWDVDTPLSGETNIAGMAGNFMVSNSDDSGAGFLLNEELISPEIDCAGWTKVRLNFSKNYKIYEDPDHQQNADVDIRVFDSVTGWSDWVNLVHLDINSVPSGSDELSAPEQIDISAYDGKTIQIRFHFYDAEFDYWFAVDSIVVSGIQPTFRPVIRAASLVGNQLTLGWEPEGSYYVEHTTDLTGTWTEIGGPITGTGTVVTIPGDPVGYYRLRAAE